MKVVAALDRSYAVGVLDNWAAAHELGAVHLQHRRNMSTAESLFQVLLTARDSLDLESGWFATADEARAALVADLSHCPHDVPIAESCAACELSAREPRQEKP